MKAILISDHAKWCALMMNGDKTIEVRKGTALYKAIQKLIDEYGFADIYVYCTKGKPYFFESDWSDNDGRCCVVPSELNKAIEYVKSKPCYGDEYIGCPCVLYGTPYGNLFEKRKYYSGKVIFKFRCHLDDVGRIGNFARAVVVDTQEELGGREVVSFYNRHNVLFSEKELLKESCLTLTELENYLENKEGTAIHISDLEVFDKPRELSEFYHYVKYNKEMATLNNQDWDFCKLTKAPQSFAYIEIE